MIEVTWNGRSYRPADGTDYPAEVHKRLMGAGFRKVAGPDLLSTVTLLHDGEVEAHYTRDEGETHAALLSASLAP